MKFSTGESSSPLLLYTRECLQYTEKNGVYIIQLSAVSFDVMIPLYSSIILYVEYNQQLACNFLLEGNIHYYYTSYKFL
jgi:hypothetical protein